MSALSQRLPVYVRLMRIDRPIGTLLLLWPTWWALWLAAEGMPPFHLLLIFTLGVFLMRSAGCVINDVADRGFDGHVKRTAGRPLARGEANVREALWLCAGLCLAAFMLVLFTNRLTVLLACAALLLALGYPFAKRFTHLPQVVLGAAFGWSIPMAFAAVGGEVPRGAWLLFIANLLWTVVYDTFYAMVDRDDDIAIGVRSTAILFGEDDRLIIGLLQGSTVLTLALVGQQFELGYWYHIGLLTAAALFAWQQFLTRHRDRSACFAAFLNNNWVGAAIFGGLVLNYLAA